MQMNSAAYRLIGKFIFAVLCLWTFKNIFFLDTKNDFVIMFNAFTMRQPVAMPSVNENTSIYWVFLRMSFVLSCLRIKMSSLLLYFITCIWEFTVIILDNSK